MYVARKIPQEALDLLARECELDVWEGDLPEPGLARGVNAADGVISCSRQDQRRPESADRLKVIANMAVGYDNIDTAAATERGVVVSNTPSAHRDNGGLRMGAHVLAAARRLPGVEYVKRGEWRTWGPELLLGWDVHGATLGLVGLGRIGRAVARRASGFDMRVLYHTPTPHEDAESATWVELDALLRESDFVSLHTPLTPETRSLIDAERLGLMKRSAVLVNTARGPIIDQAALYDALSAGRIGAAALDVTDPEPMQAGDRLLTLPNCIVVPHIGSATYRTRGKMATTAAENVLAVLRGERAPNAVNRIGV
ncbi:MAG: D-glycerate dehydrogenase [Chloroflexia bacterium]